jgi:hypothetical protein
MSAPMRLACPDALRLIAALLHDGASIRGIVEHLNAVGVKSARGGKWHIRTVQLAIRNLQNEPKVTHAT